MRYVYTYTLARASTAFLAKRPGWSTTGNTAIANGREVLARDYGTFTRLVIWCFFVLQPL